MEDEPIDSGRTNIYLVCGTRFGGPYPQGDERLAITEAFRTWWCFPVYSMTSRYGKEFCI
nr:hypothetical protein [Paenibacillus sp. MBLB1832]